MKFRKEIKIILSEAAEEYNELNRIVGDELQRKESHLRSTSLSFVLLNA